jgi:putative flavoprotein involved in K+ transport
VIGGGQAGLAVSHELTIRGIEHVVLERNRIAQTWRGRWDSFCLVTPNWTVRLPGDTYGGDDPDGYLPRDDIVVLLEAYAASFHAPVREGVGVTSLDATPDRGFRLETTTGEILADTVVLCTGAYQRPHRPSGARSFPLDLLQIDAEAYHNPAQLPPGNVLVIGSGQTGCQLAEELHQSGRDVFLACGRAPWAPRRINGRDLLHWMVQTPFMDVRITDLPSLEARLIANVQATGHDGGHDLHYRTLHGMGVTLLGRFRGVQDRRAHFAADLAESVAFGDNRYRELRKMIHQVCDARGERTPEMPDPPLFNADPPDAVDLADFGTVIFTSGFRPDYTQWVHLDAFDDLGFPIQDDGGSTIVPGLYFCGVHFMRKRKSSLLLGVGEDAAVVATRIQKRSASGREPRPDVIAERETSPGHPA